jgi:hypothetical protein
MSISIPITGIVGDPKSKSIGMINGRGSFLVLKPMDDPEEEWVVVNNITQALDCDDVPALAIDLL